MSDELEEPESDDVGGSDLGVHESGVGRACVWAWCIFGCVFVLTTATCTVLLSVLEKATP